MKVLWITNILLPEAAARVCGDCRLKASGGWMVGAAENLLRTGQVQLVVATVSSLVDRMTVIHGHQIVHYIIPYGKGNLRVNGEYGKYWRRIKAETIPDVVHIHGTEYSHGHAYMKECGADKVVVSVQGLKSAICDYYRQGLSEWDIFRNITLRDVFRGTVVREQRLFRKSAAYEREMLEMTRHIIGRTSWDRARTWAINPEAEYHFCNETLRGEFYDGSLWDYEKCHRHSIFLSQAAYPLKGLHQLLKAFPLILRHYPDAAIRVAGPDITKCATLRDRLHLTGYGRYISMLLRKSGIGDRVTFTGSLDALEMKREYLSCNVFVCPSSIENSPNSLGEAQILGVPCVACYAGGIPDMMKGNEDNLYRFEEMEMLAAKVCGIFEMKDVQASMHSAAASRHDRVLNAERLVGIYREVMK